jgi:hypothetical protein
MTVYINIKTGYTVVLVGRDKVHFFKNHDESEWVIEYEALEAEARIAELQEGWQPMETAPTDGTPFQAWTDCQEWVPRAAWAVPDGDKKKRFCVWEQVDYDGIEGWASGYTLIAWMPHPTAPKKEIK